LTYLYKHLMLANEEQDPNCRQKWPFGAKEKGHFLNRKAHPAAGMLA